MSEDRFEFMRNYHRLSGNDETLKAILRSCTSEADFNEIDLCKTYRTMTWELLRILNANCGMFGMNEDACKADWFFKERTLEELVSLKAGFLRAYRDWLDVHTKPVLAVLLPIPKGDT